MVQVSALSHEGNTYGLDASQVIEGHTFRVLLFAKSYHFNCLYCLLCWVICLYERYIPKYYGCSYEYFLYSFWHSWILDGRQAAAINLVSDCFVIYMWQDCKRGFFFLKKKLFIFTDNIEVVPYCKTVQMMKTFTSRRLIKRIMFSLTVNRFIF